jgi:ATP-dependent DNA helicase PIF1
MAFATISTPMKNIQIPDELCILEGNDPLRSLIDFVFPSNPNVFQNQAILSPTLEIVEKLNDFVLSLFPGESKVYLSADTPFNFDEEHELEGDLFRPQLLNEIKSSDIPKYRLKLKVGVPIILLRNLDNTKGLSTGTRMQVDHLGNHFITATVIDGKNIGDKVVIPKIDMVPKDSGLPFKFQRRQFPVCLCFAMTIKKSQGLSFSKVGLYLPWSVSTLGQVHVAVSRLSTTNDLKMLILDDEGKSCNTTRNVVFPEGFY